MSAKPEDYSLWKEFKENRDQEVFKKLVIKHLPLVKYHAVRIKMIVPSFIEEEDLVSYGIIGLIDAINKYNYRRGIKFKTYASRRIRGEIIDHLRRLDWLPHSLRRDARRVKEGCERLTSKLGRKPTLEEIEEEVNIDKQRIRELYNKLYSSHWVSLYDELGEVRVVDLLQGEEGLTPESIFQDKERVEVLAEAIDRLSNQEKMVISLFYYEELTQKEIAEVLDLSPARISQIHKKAVYRLRGILGKKKQELTGY